MKRSAWRYLWTSRDIRKKLLITILILVIHRFASNIPVPGVDRTALNLALNSQQAGASLFNFIDVVTGGTLRNFSVLAMGVYPYITAQIILQLLTPIIPALQKKMEDDPREGRKWMEKWTMILSIPMAALNAFGQIQLTSQVFSIEVIPGFGFGAGADVLRSITILIAMTAGTMFAIWLGELISEYGMRGQGLSLIIFAGIVSQIPSNFSQLIMNNTTGQLILNDIGRWVLILFMLVLTISTIFVIVFVQQGRRHIPVMYPGRRVGRRMSMPVDSTLPLMVNMAGMIPLIFAQSFLQFPTILTSFFSGTQNVGFQNFIVGIQTLFNSTYWTYWVFYFFMVVAFTFFYTDVLFQQQNYGENLKRSGARVKGVAPGSPTQRYLTKVLRRITLPGAIFLGLVAVMPFMAQVIVKAMNISDVNTATLLVTSSGLLIVVGTVRDLFFNIDAELKLHGYDDSLLIR
ncbi:MAG: preprotein translocase subunit SecY [Anaerolineales bacterium]|nr:preprotein translocase subunit SecY [Anaerolineales bacterium]